MPTTVISPSVSKPRKSTSITFTTLSPPACSSALLKKNGARVPSRAWRVSTANASVAHARAGDHGQRRDRERAEREHATAVRRRVDHLNSLRQPAQAQQHQHQRHHFDGDLRQRKIRRREPRERQAGDEPRAADHDQRREPMELRLQRRADGAGRPATHSNANSGSSGVSGSVAARASS